MFLADLEILLNCSTKVLVRCNDPNDNDVQTDKLDSETDILYGEVLFNLVKNN
ncbi:hypothetical protein SAMN05421841_1309 [Chryseobacterium wanjuense]|uniref:Uncharacterized protein n=1 Tax=Chryseobacterium wanjuense TaxID=356305 RepID=A0A1I0PMV0_9FLAO|nr:hypothetical protein SAMN05421841_1309 [Chryseobacterium wanjuense]